MTGYLKGNYSLRFTKHLPLYSKLFDLLFRLFWPTHQLHPFLALFYSLVCCVCMCDTRTILNPVWVQRFMHAFFRLLISWRWAKLITTILATESHFVKATDKHFTMNKLIRATSQLWLCSIYLNGQMAWNWNARCCCFNPKMCTFDAQAHTL